MERTAVGHGPPSRRREVTWEDPGVGAALALELKVNLVKPLTVDTPRVVATGQVLSSGRRVATASGQITGPDGTLYAHATTTCLVIETRQAPGHAPVREGNGDGR